MGADPQQSDPAGTPEQLYLDVRDRDSQLNQIDWLPPAPLNSAYAIAAAPDTMARWGVRTLSDLAAAFERGPDGAEDTRPVLCIDDATGFATEPDGLRQFERAFGVTIPEVQRPELATDQLYDLAHDGTFCPFIQVLNTDPRLADGGLEVLEDAGTFTVYNPSMTIRHDIAETTPGFDDLIAQLSPRLTDEAMRGLRASVEVDGESPRTVARAWLEDEHLAEQER